MKTAMEMAKIRSFGTERLTLRLMNESDWELFIDQVLIADDWYMTFGYEKCEELLMKVIKPCFNKAIYYSIFLPGTDEMVGFVGFSIDTHYIEYYIFKDYRRCGYAYEAVHEFINMLHYGKIMNMPVNTIQAWTVWENTPSIELLFKLNFHSLGFRITDEGCAIQYFSYRPDYREALSAA